MENNTNLPNSHVIDVVRIGLRKSLPGMRPRNLTSPYPSSYDNKCCRHKKYIGEVYIQCIVCDTYVCILFIPYAFYEDDDGVRREGSAVICDGCWDYKCVFCGLNLYYSKDDMTLTCEECNKLKQCNSSEIASACSVITFDLGKLGTNVC